MKQVASDVWDGIQGFANTAWETIEAIDWSGIWEAVKTTAEDVWNAIKGFATDVWNTIQTIDWASVWETVRSAAEEVWNAITGFATDVWDEIQKIDWSGIWNTVKTTAEDVWDAIKGFAQTAWQFIKELNWDTIGDAISNIWKSAETAIENFLGVSRLSFSEIQKIIDGFEMPESLKMAELQSAKENVEGLIDEINNLQRKIDSEVLKLELGIELTDKESANFGDMLRRIVEDGIQAIESEKFNMNLNIESIFGAGSADYNMMAENLLDPFYAAANASAAEKGKELLGYYVDAMASGGLTAQDAAKLALMAKNFEAEVSKAMTNLEIKANLLQLSVEKVNLKPGDIKKIVDETYKITHDAFEQAKANKNETIELTYKAAAALELDVDETRKYIDMTEKAFLNQLSGISLEGIDNVFNVLKDQINADELINRVGEIYTGLADTFEGGMESLLQAGSTGYETFAMSLENQIQGLDPQLRKNAESLLNALKPSIKDLQEIKKSFEDAGLEIPKGITEAFQRTEVLEALTGSNSQLFEYIQDRVREKAEGLGISFEDAFSQVMQDVSDALNDDLTLPEVELIPDINVKPQFDVETEEDDFKEALEGQLNGATVNQEVSIEADTEGAEQAAEEIKDAFTGELETLPDEMEPIGQEAAEKLAEGFESGADAIVEAAKEIPNAIVEEFLLNMSTDQGLQIAVAFGEGIIQGMREVKGGAGACSK